MGHAIEKSDYPEVLHAAKLSNETRRRITHIGMGLFALAVTSFWQSFLMSVSGLALAWVLPRKDRGLLRAHEQQQGYSWGILLYPASVVALTLIFHNHLWIVGGAWAMMAYGDGMAVVCGQNIPGPRLPWNPRKSVWGTFGFFFFGTLGAFLTVSFLGKHPFTPVQLLFAAAVAAGVSAVLESVPYDLSDNPIVALTTGSVLYVAAKISWATWIAVVPTLTERLPVAFVFAAVLVILAQATKSVTWSGSLTGGVIAFTLYLAFGWSGATQLMAFFILGTATSKIGYQIKKRKGTAQARRTWRNAVANAGVACVFAPLAFLIPQGSLIAVAVAASFAAATSDTVAGEIGRVYGRNPRMITTFKPAITGANGAVSMVGTLAGLVAAFAISGIAYATGLITTLTAFGVVGTAGMIGNLIDSYLGATIETKGMIDNEGVNFACTLSGALVAILGMLLF